MNNRVLQATIGLTMFLAAVTLAEDKKIKPEELVSRHLASIGTTEAIAAVHSRAIAGNAHVIFRLGGHGDMRGKANILSEGGKVRIGMNFPSNDYPGEQIAFDGSRVTTGYVRPGQRSPLSDFVYIQDVLVREGLLGGVETTAWALLNTTQRQSKLSYSGVKKIDGREMHELKYRAKKHPGELQVSLYFDPETFRHTGSQYRLVRPANMPTSITASSGQRDTLYTISERFDNFKPVDGLTLPHTYRIVFTVEGEQTVLQDWGIEIEELSHNNTIDPKYFAVQ